MCRMKNLLGYAPAVIVYTKDYLEFVDRLERLSALLAGERK